MPKLRTGPFYEKMAALPTLDSLKVTREGTYSNSPGRAERRKAERAMRRKDGRARQNRYVRVMEYAESQIEGKQARRFAVVGAMAQHSREAYARGGA